MLDYKFQVNFSSLNFQCPERASFLIFLNYFLNCMSYNIRLFKEFQKSDYINLKLFPISKEICQLI